MEKFLGSFCLVVILAAPVWLAAQLTGARRASFWRAILALVVGTVILYFLPHLLRIHGLWVAPVVYLLSCWLILDTTLLGAILLGIIAYLGYLAEWYVLVHILHH